MTIHYRCEAYFLQLSYFSVIIAFPTDMVGSLNGSYLYFGNKSVDTAPSIATQV